MQRSVVVVGAGPAGMAAAMEAALRGCRVTIIDEARLPGGQVYRQADGSLIGEEYADAAELNRKHRLLEKFDRAMSSLDYRSGCSVYAVFPNGEVHFAEQDHTRLRIESRPIAGSMNDPSDLAECRSRARWPRQT